MVLWNVSLLNTSRHILALQTPGDFRIILDSLFSLLIIPKHLKST